MKPPAPQAEPLIRFNPEELYFCWHPGGPTFDGSVRSVRFIKGRVPGAVSGQAAERLTALGCICVPYEPGLDVVRWEQNPDGVPGMTAHLEAPRLAAPAAQGPRRSRT